MAMGTGRPDKRAPAPSKPSVTATTSEHKDTATVSSEPCKMLM